MSVWCKTHMTSLVADVIHYYQTRLYKLKGKRLEQTEKFAAFYDANKLEVLTHVFLHQSQKEQKHKTKPYVTGHNKTHICDWMTNKQDFKSIV